MTARVVPGSGGHRGVHRRLVAVDVPITPPRVALGVLDRGVVGRGTHRAGIASELLHHHMETGMLQGIKARAEATRSDGQPAAQVIA